MHRYDSVVCSKVLYLKIPMNVLEDIEDKNMTHERIDMSKGKERKRQRGELNRKLNWKMPIPNDFT